MLPKIEARPPAASEVVKLAPLTTPPAETVGAATVTIEAAARVSPPPVAVIVNVAVVAAVPAAALSVNEMSVVVVAVNEVVRSEVTPFGYPVSVSGTDPVKPLSGVTVSV